MHQCCGSTKKGSLTMTLKPKHTLIIVCWVRRWVLPFSKTFSSFLHLCYFWSSPKLNSRPQVISCFVTCPFVNDGPHYHPPFIPKQLWKTFLCRRDVKSFILNMSSWRFPISTFVCYTLEQMCSFLSNVIMYSVGLLVGSTVLSKEN